MQQVKFVSPHIKVFLYISDFREIKWSSCVFFFHFNIHFYQTSLFTFIFNVFTPILSLFIPHSILFCFILHVVFCSFLYYFSFCFLFCSVLYCTTLFLGIHIFATGGIGGVHRGAETSMDISADLTELGRTPVTVVCAGVKSILDIRKTLEVLETQGMHKSK